MNISLHWFSWSLWTGSWFWAVFAVVLWQIVVAALCWTARTRLGRTGPGRAWTRAEQICFRCHFTERETWYLDIISWWFWQFWQSLFCLQILSDMIQFSPIRFQTELFGSQTSASLKLVYVFISSPERTGWDEHGCTVRSSRNFPSSVSGSGSSEASVQIQTTALRPQSLNGPLTAPWGTHVSTERCSFPSAHVFVPFSSGADPANIQPLSRWFHQRGQKFRCRQAAFRWTGTKVRLCGRSRTPPPRTPGSIVTLSWDRTWSFSESS